MGEKYKAKCYWCGCEDYEISEHEAYALHDENGNPIGPKYKHIVVYCPECEHVFQIEEVNQGNLERKRQAERDFLGVVPYEDFLKLPKKYGVPREMIDIILNLESDLMLKDGAYGVSLWDGEVPTSDESDRIQKALDDPAYFLECMDKTDLPDDFCKRVRPRIEKMAKKG